MHRMLLPCLSGYLILRLVLVGTISYVWMSWSFPKVCCIVLVVQKIWVCCVVPCSVVLAGTHGVYVVFVMVVNHNLWCSMSCCIYSYKIMVRSCCSLSCCAERCRSANLNVVAWAEGANQANQDQPPLLASVPWLDPHILKVAFSCILCLLLANAERPPEQHNSFYVHPKNKVSIKVEDKIVYQIVAEQLKQNPVSISVALEVLQVLEQFHYVFFTR